MTPNPVAPFKAPDAKDLSVCKGPYTQAPSTCYMPKDIIEINICDPHTQKKKTYEIPRALLEWHSSYFAAALDPENDFMRNADGKIGLEGDFQVFDAFVCWLYTGRVKDPPESFENATWSDIYLPHLLLSKIWVFADMRGVPGLANTAIDMLHENVAAVWAVSESVVSYVYKNTLAGAQLRKFLVDAFVLTKSPDSFLDSMEADVIPSQFLMDALPHLISRGKDAKNIGRTAWAKLDRCQWHDHSGPGGKLRFESRK
ncbi:hypothetical protein CC86DRAFT_116306 [Ophiobolus disseminans]|uniref:BTB domain-containing protein n=1 Tax=Ophiobolus disseminans TaxID=1469910 RepID=A0A6A6ZHY4_9PLEO|nr:hypothetical protein CC86DRAFT_116306 [Ophiobolus disseminans]